MKYADRMSQKSERVRLAAFKALEHSKSVLSEEVAEIADVTHQAASLMLNNNYERWGLQMDHVVGPDSIERQSYRKRTEAPDKCEYPSIPDHVSLLPGPVPEMTKHQKIKKIVEEFSRGEVVIHLLKLNKKVEEELDASMDTKREVIRILKEGGYNWKQ